MGMGNREYQGHLLDQHTLGLIAAGQRNSINLSTLKSHALITNSIIIAAYSVKTIAQNSVHHHIRRFFCLLSSRLPRISLNFTLDMTYVTL